MNKPSADSCLIIMAKPPIKGKVKTRLAKTLGEDKALEIYRLMLDKTFQLRASSKWDSLVFWTENHTSINYYSKDQKLLQASGDLGVKMHSAIETALSEGHKNIVLIGTDCPDNSLQNIEEAFLKLRFNDLVLGPSNDGGYYLVGMKRSIPELFTNITWSTELVFKETTAIANKLGLTFDLSPELIDVDDESDLNSSDYFKK